MESRISGSRHLIALQCLLQAKLTRARRGGLGFLDEVLLRIEIFGHVAPDRGGFGRGAFAGQAEVFDVDGVFELIHDGFDVGFDLLFFLFRGAAAGAAGWWRVHRAGGRVALAARVVALKDLLVWRFYWDVDPCE